MKYKSKCHGVRICKDSIGLILNRGRYAELGVCPQCMRFCAYEEEHSKISHAALQLLKNIKKGMIIVIAIVILFPIFLFVLMLTHVIRIEHKITLSPLMRIRDDHKEMR